MCSEELPWAKAATRGHPCFSQMFPGFWNTAICHEKKEETGQILFVGVDLEDFLAMERNRAGHSETCTKSGALPRCKRQERFAMLSTGCHALSSCPGLMATL